MRRLRSDSGAVAVEFRPGDGSDLVGGGSSTAAVPTALNCQCRRQHAKGVRSRAFGRWRCNVWNPPEERRDFRRRRTLAGTHHLTDPITYKNTDGSSAPACSGGALVTVTVTYPLTSLTGMSHRPSRARILRERV